MCASHGDFSKPQGAMKVKASFGNSPRQDPGAVTSAGRTAGPSDAAGVLPPSAGRSKSAHVGTRKMVNYA